MKNSFMINETTINDIQQAMENGNLTAKKLTALYLEQIAKYNQQGPKINAVLEINPDALFIAESLDLERQQKGPRGPLHGIPLLLKDNIDTGDKTHTTAGSLALKDHYAKEDAFLTKKLRDAGAIILGKSNLTEFANFMAVGMPNGYSSHGGQVLNPYGPGKFDVGGSSSGPGAAIAANFALGAIGTETSGSILSPASSNSLVGIKPTVGLISRTGVIPIASSQDTAGPLARTVTDAALILDAMTGVDESDPATKTNPNSITDYTNYLNKDGLKGKRLGISRDYIGNLPDEELELVNKALIVMEELGATIVDPIALPTDLPVPTVLFHEFKNGLNAYLSTVDHRLKLNTLLDIINFNQSHAKDALKYGQKLLIDSEKKSGTLTEAEYINDRLKDLRLSQDEGIDMALNKDNLDALIFANNHGASIAAKAGYPSITVPAGYTSDGKPVGITFTGSAFTEGQLIELAYSYEQTTKHRKAPVLD
ncbi:amidase family protein [Ornithinibacillus halophilus]|uniref:Amidase n=1 Tax=Ornithinibacillus halophilus TaxID=930117 RepID=A0A1M5H1Y2_9BACI|nr:amidase family protein [Ornithinibacillus halophilus]SHG09925.1 amidase [Ornithinibacillus halophilus]